jgi:hypothetical protein
MGHSDIEESGKGGGAGIVNLTSGTVGAQR